MVTLQPIETTVDAIEARGHLLTEPLDLGHGGFPGALHLLAPDAETIDEHGDAAENAGGSDQVSGIGPAELRRCGGLQPRTPGRGLRPEGPHPITRRDTGHGSPHCP